MLDQGIISQAEYDEISKTILAGQQLFDSDKKPPRPVQNNNEKLVATRRSWQLLVTHCICNDMVRTWFDWDKIYNGVRLSGTDSSVYISEIVIETIAFH